MLLEVGTLDERIGIIHIIPEDGTVERFGLTPPFTYNDRYSGAVESAREQIGVVTLGGDDEAFYSFLRDIEARARILMKTSWSSQQQSATNTKVAQLAQDVLRPAALDAMREREERAPLSATQTYPVYVVHIKRYGTRSILGLTSF